MASPKFPRGAEIELCTMLLSLCTLRFAVAVCWRPYIILNIMSLWIYKNILVLMSGVPGDSDSIHLTIPHTPEGPVICFGRFVFVFTCDLCNNRTQDEYPEIKENNVTSHPTPRARYYTWYCSATSGGLLLGCVHCITVWLMGYMYS